jgi:hypothetical protein
MTVPVYRPSKVAIALGLSFWLMLGGLAYAVYAVVVG